MFVSQFQMPHIQFIGNVDCSADELPSVVVVIRQHSTGVQVRLADQITSEQRAFDKHQREDSRDPVALCCPDKPRAMTKCFFKDGCPFATQMKSVIAPFLKIRIPFGWSCLSGVDASFDDRRSGNCCCHESGLREFV